MGRLLLEGDVAAPGDQVVHNLVRQVLDDFEKKYEKVDYEKGIKLKMIFVYFSAIIGTLYRDGCGGLYSSLWV